MIEIKKILEELAVRRPVFHSEADFKFALAWAIQEATRNAKIRLEVTVHRTGLVEEKPGTT